MEPYPIMPFEDFPAYLEDRKSTARYDSQAEPKPEHPWWQLPKSEIDMLLRDFSQMVVDLLRGSPSSDKELDHLSRTASELSHVQASPAVKVALLGAQGAGKSLMINALFDRNGLSLTGAEGAACTSSVSKYVQYPKNAQGEDKVFAQVQFFSRNKREVLLKEHARSYFHYHCAEEDDDDEEDGVRFKMAGQDDMDRTLSDTAEDVFVTLFGSHDAFRDSWSMSAYKSGEFVSVCQLKCEEELQKEKADMNGVVAEMADNPKDLLAQLRPFLTSVKGERCLWPLVDNIAIRFYHDLLNGGVEVIDLPGWGDLNLSRTRHAEEIKDSVDVIIILADTIRIASDAKVINSARGAMAFHGADKVKVVATKIDSLTADQLAQCAGGDYDRISNLLQNVEDQEAAMEENGDDDEKLEKLIAQYKLHLERCRKQRKVVERATKITAELTSKLQGRKASDMPQVFHASASDYMEWLKRPKLKFDQQPALSPEMTGIPAIRNLLFSLPAEQNLRDYERHINIVLPAFINKMRRTVADHDRDSGFRTIADRFDKTRASFMDQLLNHAKAAFQECSDHIISMLESEFPTFREQLEERVILNWFEHKSGAWNRILKCRGVVPKGASKARGLENGCDWNQEIANLLAPGFNKWSNAYNYEMKCMADALPLRLAQLHSKVNIMMEDCGANMVIVERARKKWRPLRSQLQAKTGMLMSEVYKVEKTMHSSAIMEFNQERNVIAYVTDELYTKVFESCPEEKPAPPTETGKKRRYKRYVMPKLKFQKKYFEALFLSHKNHIVDEIINQFKDDIDRAIRKLVEEHFAGINKLFDDFSAVLRAEAHIDYCLTPEGESIRAELKQQIPILEEKAAELHKLLPHCPKKEDDSTQAPFDGATGFDIEDDILPVILDKMAKRKRIEALSSTKSKATVKRMKTETD